MSVDLSFTTMSTLLNVVKIGLVNSWQVYCSRVNSFSRFQSRWSHLFSKKILVDFGQCIHGHLMNAQNKVIS